MTGAYTVLVNMMWQRRCKSGEKGILLGHQPGETLQLPHKREHFTVIFAARGKLTLLAPRPVRRGEPRAGETWPFSRDGHKAQH